MEFFWERNSLAKHHLKKVESLLFPALCLICWGPCIKKCLFHNSDHEVIEEQIQKYLNGNQDFLSPRTLQSTRAAGDALQDIMGDKFHEFAGIIVRILLTILPDAQWQIWLLLTSLVTTTLLM